MILINYNLNDVRKQPIDVNFIKNPIHTFICFKRILWKRTSINFLRMDIKSTHSTDLIKHVMSMSASRRMTMSSHREKNKKKVMQRMYVEAIGENSRDVHSDTNEMSFTIFNFFYFIPIACQLRVRKIFSIHFFSLFPSPIVIEIEENDYIIPTYFFFFLYC